MGDGWSVAWRVHDAQYWGVPQRRKRICVLADFNGDTAGKILFELQRDTNAVYGKPTELGIGEQSRPEVQPFGKSLPGHSAESGEQRQDTARAAGHSTSDTGRATFDVRISSDGTKNWRAHAYPTDICRALDTGGADPDTNHGGICVVDENAERKAVVYGISAYDSNSMKSSNPHSGIYEAKTTRTLDNNGGNPACNQGGMIVLEGNGSRPSHQGDGYAESETMYTLNTIERHAVCIENHPADSRVKINDDGVDQTLSSRMGTGGGNVPLIMEEQNKEAYCIGNGQAEQTKISEKVGTLNCMHDQQAVMVYGLERAAFNQGANAQYSFSVEEEKIGTQVAKGPGAVASFYPQMKAESNCYREDDVSNTLVNGTNPGYQNGIVTSIVRRLTPMETERLQDFPDDWTQIGEWVDSKGKKHKDSDSPRYKAMGNSIALPFWQWLADRIVAQLKHDGAEETTMASLFSGVGGFELVFARAGCKPLWASEIEEFPIAVAKKHFGDEETGQEGDYKKYI